MDSITILDINNIQEVSEAAGRIVNRGASSTGTHRQPGRIVNRGGNLRRGG